MEFSSRSTHRIGADPKPHSSRKAIFLYGDSERDANMLYATRIFVPDPFLYFRVKGKSTIVISDMEYSRAKREAHADEVLSYREVLARIPEKGKHGKNVLHICMFMAERMKVRFLEVPASFPVSLADDLRREGLSVRARLDPFFPERSIKTEEETEKIRKSLKAAEAGMKEALKALRASIVDKRGRKELKLGGEYLTSERLRSLIEKTILDRRCHAIHTIVAGGPQGYDPHERGNGRLKADQPIIIDIFPRSEVTGYYGDMTRTFLKGKASSRALSMYFAVKEAQDYAVSRIKAGAQAKGIHQGVVDLFSRKGFPTREEEGRMVGFIHGTGHGLGLDIHEHPGISTRPCRLKRGHVVTVEPGLYYPDVGGVRLEDVVWIGRDGVKKLTRFPRFLEV